MGQVYIEGGPQIDKVEDKCRGYDPSPNKISMSHKGTVGLNLFSANNPLLRVFFHNHMCFKNIYILKDGNYEFIFKNKRRILGQGNKFMS